MRQFHLYQLWFLVPGLGLVWLGYYLPASYIYQQLYWVETEAVITGYRLDTTATPINYYLMDYTDSLGTVFHIEVDVENTITEGRDADHARLYYDPADPANFALVNHALYLVVLFLPLGLLSLYFGWPKRE